MLREAGALEVHVRISSPPVAWPCFYGVDFASRAELIANGLSTDEICRSIGADSLGYISLEGLVEATTVPMAQLCRACYDGVYPIELPDSVHLGKHVLEQTALPILPPPVASTGVDVETPPWVDADTSARVDADGVPTGVGGGALDALRHP
jgi:amidophosphoribosyltransferase